MKNENLKGIRMNEILYDTFRYIHFLLVVDFLYKQELLLLRQKFCSEH